MKIAALDHIALWTNDRDLLARFLCNEMGMHERGDRDRFVASRLPFRISHTRSLVSPGDSDSNASVA